MATISSDLQIELISSIQPGPEGKVEKGVANIPSGSQIAKPILVLP